MGKTLKVDITAMSPLNIGSKKPYGHFLETLDYIPGSVVRGAFAKLLMKSNKMLFDKLFVESQDTICFGNFYPKTSLNAPDVPLVLPMTAVSCKYEEGFCTGYDEILRQDDTIKKQANIDETDKPPHGVFDTLITELVFEQLPFAFQPRCPKCGERVEPFTGYYDVKLAENQKRNASTCKANNNPRAKRAGEAVVQYYQMASECLKECCSMSYRRAKCKTQRVTKSAINRKRNVVEDEMLYSVSAICPPKVFCGLVAISDDSLLEEVTSHLRLLEQGRLGGGGSRGFGKITITNIAEHIEPEPVDEVKDRIVAFNEKTTEVAEFYQPFCQEPISIYKWYFTIGFHSDAILLDELGRSTPTLTSEKLKQLLCLPDANICLKRYYSRMSERGGWSFAWKLLKEKEAVLEKGSVFLFWTPDIEPLYEPLARLQLNGIGEKREEGLGKIIVCDDFHQEVYRS